MTQSHGQTKKVLNSQEREGMIKFSLVHQDQSIHPDLLYGGSELIHWRTILKELGLIGGGDPQRYHGDGFGNISMRICSKKHFDPEGDSQTFLITGSQTGHIDDYTLEHLVLVKNFDLLGGSIESQGIVLPSSESLTHAILYQLNPQINWVFHVHAPKIWHMRKQLNLTCTSPSSAYGTIEMAQEVQELYLKLGSPKNHLIAMEGHQDGLISFGSHATSVGNLLIHTLKQAMITS